MKLYSASFSTILWRFYLMMAIGIASVVTGMYFIAVLCLPLLMMSLLGMSFTSQDEKSKINKETIAKDFSMSREAA